ncbi:MAG TPA: hypothetical protein VKV22_01185 [Rhodanobacteraceae bacterium]|nr:hypothetical protein [Rhodanobacteraceae bacterium]
MNANDQGIPVQNFVTPELRAPVGRTRLQRQDAGANIGAADGPKGEPQDAANLIKQTGPKPIPDSAAINM